MKTIINGIKVPDNIVLKCRHCKDKIDNAKDVKIWRWKPWCAVGHASPPPERKNNTWDVLDFMFHKSCVSEWMSQRDREYQELDRTMNSCKYFERIGSSNIGYYKRDNKKHLALGYWTASDIEGGNLFPYIDPEMKLDKNYIRIVIADHKQLLADFVAFLRKNNWADYYAPRDR